MSLIKIFVSIVLIIFFFFFVISVLFNMIVVMIGKIVLFFILVCVELKYVVKKVFFNLFFNLESM